MWWSLFRKTSGEVPPSIDDGSEKCFSTEDEMLIEKLAQKIVRMRMTVPAIFFLESSKPLAFLGSQLLVFFEPFVQTLFNFEQYQRFALLMEDRSNWERLLRKIEELDAASSKRQDERKKKKP